MDLKYLSDGRKDIEAKRAKKRLDDIEARFEEVEKKLAKANQELKGAMELSGQSNLVDFDINHPAFETLMKFISGSIEWVVINQYKLRPPIKFKDAMINDEIKLLSVFGKSDGNIKYRINRYNDGSGSKEIYPFETYDKAMDYITARQCEAIRKSAGHNYTPDYYKDALNIGVIFPADCQEIMLRKYSESLTLLESLDKKAEEKRRESKDKLQSSISELKNSLGNF